MLQMIGPFLFLDIDGVLNRHNRHANGYCGMDRDCVDILNGILETTKAKVVLASAWRYFVLRGEMTLAGLQGLLCTHGLPWGCLAGVLKEERFNDPKRGELVVRWFSDSYGGITGPFCCVDDMDLGYRERGLPFVQTASKEGLAGLSPSDVQDIVNSLRGEVR